MKNSPKTLDAPINESPYDRRRGKRLFLSFPIAISGIDKEGKQFIEHTMTDDISDTGCSLHTNIPLESGDMLDIKLILAGGPRHSEEKPQQFEIMWVAPEKTGWSVGVRKIHEGSIWKVTFPPRPPRSTSDLQSM